MPETLVQRARRSLGEAKTFQRQPDLQADALTALLESVDELITELCSLDPWDCLDPWLVDLTEAEFRAHCALAPQTYPPEVVEATLNQVRKYVEATCRFVNIQLWLVFPVDDEGLYRRR